MSIPGLILSALLLVLVVCLVVILSVRIRLEASFGGALGSEFHSDLRVSFFGGRITKKFEPRKKPAEIRKETRKRVKKLPLEDRIDHYAGLFKRFRYVYEKRRHHVRKSVLFEKIMLNVTFGLDDAFKTGVATGTLWGIIYNIIAVLSRIVRIIEPEISVNPLFDNECFEVSGECIVSFRLANIISMLLKLGITYYLIDKKLSKKEKAAINNGNSN